MRKVKYSIFLKIVLLCVFLLGISLSSYVYYAINLFKDDKISYVYESVDNSNEKTLEKWILLSGLLRGHLVQYRQERLNNFDLQQFLQKYQGVSGLFHLNSGKLQKSISLEGSEVKLSENDVKKIVLANNPLVFHSGKLFLLDKKLDNEVFGILMDPNKLFLGNDSQIFSHKILVDDNVERTDEAELFSYLESKNFTDHTFYFAGKNEKIVSSRSLEKGIYLITSTDYSKALEVSKRLQKNSLFFGTLILGAVLFLVLIFSRILTRPIQELTQVVASFYQNNFTSRAQTKTADEIGLLSHTFNKMADDINSYIVQVEEKVKLEEELKTANLVQSQFIPAKSINKEKFIISGHYQSASQCGGDWWGVLETPNGISLIIADVTGHGTPAALMTAVLHSSLNSLEFLSMQNPKYLASPALILDFLNKSFCASTKSLNATAFVINLNFTEKKMYFANASHNAPLVLPSKPTVVEKSEIIPLMDFNSKRLGEDKETNYSEGQMEIEKGMKVILFTDGILEEFDPSGKAYGQRNFIKSILSHQALTTEEMNIKIIDDFYQKIQKTNLTDDLTLINLEVRSL